MTVRGFFCMRDNLMDFAHYNVSLMKSFLCKPFSLAAFTDGQYNYGVKTADFMQCCDEK